MIAFVDVPIVHFSVTWWRTLHQEATVFDPALKAHIHGVMAFTLWFGVLAFTLVYVALLDRRYRLAALEEDLDARELEQAIAERLAGAGTPATARPRRGGRMSDVGYVVAGWSITGAVLLGYWLWLVRRTRRAERLDGDA